MQKLTINRKPAGKFKNAADDLHAATPAKIPPVTPLSPSPPAVAVDVPAVVPAPAAGPKKKNISPSQKRYRALRRAARDILGVPALPVMAEAWPHLFARYTAPFSIGITEMLIADASARSLPLTPEQIRAGISVFCRKPVYQKVVAFGVYRMNLDGSEGIAITPDEKAQAIEHLRKTQAGRFPKPS